MKRVKLVCPFGRNMICKILFDGLFIMQIISELQHEFEKLQGKEPCEIVTVNSIISDAFKQTNKLMGR